MSLSRMRPAADRTPGGRKHISGIGWPIGLICFSHVSTFGTGPKSFISLSKSLGPPSLQGMSLAQKQKSVRRISRVDAPLGSRVVAGLAGPGQSSRSACRGPWKCCLPAASRSGQLEAPAALILIRPRGSRWPWAIFTTSEVKLEGAQ